MTFRLAQSSMCLALVTTGCNVLDVWESEQAFGTFMEQRLQPAIQEIGIQGQPEVKFFPLHGVFAPALGKNEQVSDL